MKRFFIVSENQILFQGVLFSDSQIAGRFDGNLNDICLYLGMDLVLESVCYEYSDKPLKIKWIDEESVIPHV